MAALRAGAGDIVARVVAGLRADIAALPANNVVVLEHQAELAAVRADGFWARLSEDDLGYLRRTVAPLLRARRAARTASTSA